MRHTCPTGKVGYYTRTYALEAARRAKLTRGIDLKVYGCDRCLAFHLTSKAQGPQTMSDLCRIAAAQGRQITYEENAYLRKRLREIEQEVGAYWEQVVLDAFRESLDRRAQREILKEFGL